MLLVLGDREIDVTHRALVLEVGDAAVELLRRSTDENVEPIIGPFESAAPERIALVAAAIIDGARVIVSTAASSDRRVAEVMARILEAREQQA